MKISMPEPLRQALSGYPAEVGFLAYFRDSLLDVALLRLRSESQKSAQKYLICNSFEQTLLGYPVEKGVNMFENLYA